MRILSFLIFLSSCLWPFTSGLEAAVPHARYHAPRSSDRNLLALKGFTAGSSDASGVATRTLRVLAIRVDFQEQDNVLTNGNGKFETVADTSRIVDAPPHDLRYFQSQLTAIKNYFETVSRGKLLLETEVFPKSPLGSYTVSQPLSFYVPAGDEALLDQRLAEFFQEAFQVADAAGEIDFSAFDVFVVFHAGVGSDFSFDFDPTPQDMPSVFLDASTLRQQLGNGEPAFPGVAVNAGAFHITDGIVLPETESQEGFEIGLLGTGAIMFGSQLGLPLLFNPDTGRSGIGVFGLMDQGSGNFFGLLPAEPSAWEKVFLGWETPIQVASGSDLVVAAPQAANDSKIYKLPINSHEYFLIENRNRDIDGDGIAVGRDADGRRVEFHWDNNGQRVLREGSGTEPLPVITQMDEYDFGLPGSGILIWHVDEAVIAANIADNRVNADPERRGVDLEEADGAQDIGQLYGFLSAGAGAENGVIEDMFWKTNDINKLVNSSEVVEFTPTTTPGSRSNSGANTQIFVTDFSDPDSLMTFSVSNAIVQTGFPQIVRSGDARLTSPVVADINGAAGREIVVADRSSGNVFAWRADGSALLPGPVPAAMFANVQGEAFAPAVARAGGSAVVVVASSTGVSGFAPVDGNGDGLADVAFSFSGEGIRTPPLVVGGATDFNVVVGTDAGAIIEVSSSGAGSTLQNVGAAIQGLALLQDRKIVFSSSSGVGLVSDSGQLLWQMDEIGILSTAPVVADFDQDGMPEVGVLTDEGTLLLVDEAGDLKNGFPRSLDMAVGSQIAVGNIDEDPFLEMVFLSADGRLVALNHAGFLADNFPVEIGRRADTSATHVRSVSPVLTDLTGDGRAEIVVGTTSNSLAAIDAEGRSVAGFPLATGDASGTTPFIADLDGDGDSEVVSVLADGSVIAFDLSSSYDPNAVSWPGFLGGENHAGANVQQNTVSAGSGRLLPRGSVYNYPNPTVGEQTTIRYSLREQANVRVKIYDLSGAFVDELVGPGFGQTENEVSWPLRNISSGVYLARVEARSQKDNDVAIIKIAVVK